MSAWGFDKPLGVVCALGVALFAPLLLSACDLGSGLDVPTVTFRGPEDHTYFPITSGPHAGIACDSCHGAFDTFTRFTCVDCHTHAQSVTDPAHAAVSGYEYDSFACLGCHPDGLASGASGIDHGRLFPIGQGTRHEGVSCSTCHLDPSNRRALACAGCHPHDEAPTGAAHAQVGGYAFESDLCVRCHWKSQVDRVDEHLPFLIRAGTPHAAPVACLECHTDVQADRPWAADFTRRVCTTCHAETPTRAIHTRVSSYRWADDACQGCHPSGEGGLDPASHAPFFPIGPGTSHEVAACSDCHLDPTDPRAAFGCRECHLGSHVRTTMAPVHDRVGSIYAWESQACLECHPKDHVVRRSNHSTRRFDGKNVSQGPHGSKRCSECHATRAFLPFDCSPCHDPGGKAEEKTWGCDRALGHVCSAQEKYDYYYK